MSAALSTPLWPFSLSQGGKGQSGVESTNLLPLTVHPPRPISNRIPPSVLRIPLVTRSLLPVLGLLLCLPAFVSAGNVIDSMDEVRFRAPKEKGRPNWSRARSARRSGSPSRRTPAAPSSPATSAAAGLGQGGRHLVLGQGRRLRLFGGLQLIYDDDFAVRYDFCFPIKGKEWTKVTVAWDDFVPVLPGAEGEAARAARRQRRRRRSAPCGSASGGTGATIPAHSFAIDEIRLEETIERDAKDYRPDGRPAGAGAGEAEGRQAGHDRHRWATR